MVIFYIKEFLYFLDNYYETLTHVVLQISFYIYGGSSSKPLGLPQGLQKKNLLQLPLFQS